MSVCVDSLETSGSYAPDLLKTVFWSQPRMRGKRTRITGFSTELASGTYAQNRFLFIFDAKNARASCKIIFFWENVGNVCVKQLPSFLIGIERMRLALSGRRERMRSYQKAYRFRRFSYRKCKISPFSDGSSMCRRAPMARSFPRAEAEFPSRR